MAEHRSKKTAKTAQPENETTSPRGRFAKEGHSSIELDESVSLQGLDINLGGKRMGGPTGGDLRGGGKGPAIGATHPADDDTADHYGSREETNAALEDKIALQNTLKLHDHF